MEEKIPVRIVLILGKSRTLQIYTDRTDKFQTVGEVMRVLV
jgi:hypothetical protein